jgi:hypothetical protein
MGTLIRHARPPTPVFPLAVPMIESAFRASLMATVGAATLPASGLGLARRTAIALSAIAVPADPEHCVASQTGPLTKDRLAMKIHARRHAGLDNGDRSWQVRTSSDVWLPAEGRQTGRPAALTAGHPVIFPPSTKNSTPSPRMLMIDG